MTTLAWRDGKVVERFGPLALTFAAAPSADGAVLARVPLPRRSVPAVTGTTAVGPGGLVVRVEVRSRQGRRILAYGGTLIGAPSGMRAMSDRPFGPSNAPCSWVARSARS